MGAGRYSVSLRVKHPTWEPRKISEELGLEPTRSWMVGQPRETPKGTSLPGIYKETYWYVELFNGRIPPFTLATDVDRALDALQPRLSFFREIQETGGRCEFFIGLFFRSQAGETFSHETLTKMGNLGIDLSFDNYMMRVD